MPRITVTAHPDEERAAERSPVLLDEQVDSIHLSTDHAAGQLIERLAWAVSDAERLEHSSQRAPTAGGRRPSFSPSSARQEAGR